MAKSTYLLDLAVSLKRFRRMWLYRQSVPSKRIYFDLPSR